MTSRLHGLKMASQKKNLIDKNTIKIQSTYYIYNEHNEQITKSSRNSYIYSNMLVSMRFMSSLKIGRDRGQTKHQRQRGSNKQQQKKSKIKGGIDNKYYVI